MLRTARLVISFTPASKLTTVDQPVGVRRRPGAVPDRVAIVPDDEVRCEYAASSRYRPGVPAIAR
jgi:hypothetical protein